ncbi:MAG TPA: TonB-dependent receptor [Pyrinomonadaceae bacterium]|jgi:outer membrane receptor protein involved in Fe transport
MIYHLGVPSKVLSACLIFVAFVCAARAQGGSPTPEPRPTLRGVVVDQNGAPVAGAEVWMHGKGAFDPLVVRTDAEGRFAVGPIRLYGFWLSVSAPGFEKFERRWKADEWDGAEVLRVVLRPHALDERVSVTAARTETRLAETAASVVVLGAQELETAAALTADEVLRQVPGFQLFRRTSSRAANPTAQGVSLRGVGASGASRAVVLYGRVPLNDPFGGWVYWGRVPREGLERVEVLRGASSALYGSGALGGVVQFVPREANDTQLRFETSYGTQHTPDASLYASTLKNRWGISVSAQTFNTGGYVLVDRRERGPVDTPAASRNAYGELYVRRNFANGLFIFARPSYYGESRRNGTPQQFNRTHVRQLAAGVSWNTTRAGLFDLRAHASTQVLDQSFTAVAADRASETLTRLQRVPAQGAGLSFQWSRAFGTRHAIVTGFEASEARGASDELVYVAGRPSSLVGAGGRARTVGFYARDALRLTDRLVVTPGLRFDRWRNYRAQQTTRALTGARAVTTVGFDERTETAFSPQLAAVFKVSDALSLNATFARAFRAPTLNELYRSFRVGNVVTLADENLRAERLTSGEAGLIYTNTRRGLVARAGLFRADVTRPVANVTLSVTPALITRTRRNLGRTRTVGFEAEFEKRLGNGWTASAGYLFADARVESFPADAALEGRRLPQVARHQLGFQLRYVPRGRGVSFGLQARASGAQFDDDQNQLRLGRYFTLDAFVSRRLARGVEAFAAAENLTGQRYEVGRTPVLTLGPPAFVRVGLRLRLPGRRD